MANVSTILSGVYVKLVLFHAHDNYANDMGERAMEEIRAPCCGGQVNYISMGGTQNEISLPSHTYPWPMRPHSMSVQWWQYVGL